MNTIAKGYILGNKNLVMIFLYQKKNQNLNFVNNLIGAQLIRISL